MSDRNSLCTPLLRDPKIVQNVAVALVMIVLAASEVAGDANTTTASTLQALGALLDGTQESSHTIFSKAGYDCKLFPHCPRSYNGYHLNFSAVVPGDSSSINAAFADWNRVQTKQYGTLLTGTNHHELCGVRDMLPVWKDNLLSAPRNTTENSTLLWQYYAGISEEFGVYPPVPWVCSNSDSTNYKPSTRPYFGAASEARDVVILLDLSARSSEVAGHVPTRFNLIKAAALSIIGTLTHADFLAVVTYSSTADTTSISAGTLSRATETHLNSVKAKIAALAVPRTRESADMASALSAAANLLTKATNQGNTANCVQTVVLLTSGANELQSVDNDPGQAFVEIPNTVVSVNLVAYDPSSDFLSRSRALACNFKGIFRTTWSAEENSAFARAMVDYFAALAVNPEVRWSEPYWDAFGQGRIVSAVRPIYSEADKPAKFQGVLVMDVSVQALIPEPGNPAAEELLRADLLTGRSCHGVGRGDQDGVLDALRGQNQCPPKVDSVELEATRTKAGFIALSVFLVFPLAFPIHFLVVCIVSWARRSSVAAAGSNERQAVILGGSMFVWAVIGFFIVLPVYWVAVYPGEQRRDHWDRVTLRVERHEQNAFRCCAKTCFSCQTANANLTTCSLANTIQKSTMCADGYSCCEWKCTCSACRNKGRRRSFATTRKKSSSSSDDCSCCRYCARGTDNNLCALTCGTCYHPTLTTSFDYKGETLYTRLPKHCGQNDTKCRDDYLAANPISKETSILALVNPENPAEVRLSDGYNHAAFIAFVFFVGVMGLIWLGSLLALIAAGCTTTGEQQQQQPCSGNPQGQWAKPQQHNSSPETQQHNSSPETQQHNSSPAPPPPGLHSDQWKTDESQNYSSSHSPSNAFSPTSADGDNGEPDFPRESKSKSHKSSKSKKRKSHHDTDDDGERQKSKDKSKKKKSKKDKDCANV